MKYLLKKFKLAIIIVLLLSTKLHAQIWAFEHVTIIPMEGDTLLSDQTVIVRNGKIETIANAHKVVIPSDAKRINCSGKFMLPGLIDCYTHIHEKSLLLDLANGVTTVVNAIGEPYQHALKLKVDRGELEGPRIYSVGSPLASTPAV